MKLLLATSRSLKDMVEARQQLKEVCHVLRMCMFTLATLPAVVLAEPPTREQKVRADRKKVEAQGLWIYNDLAKGFAEARRTGKPLLVVLRCIPCEECVKLDDDLVDQDPAVRP